MDRVNVDFGEPLAYFSVYQAIGTSKEPSCRALSSNRQKKKRVNLGRGCRKIEKKKWTEWDSNPRGFPLADLNREGISLS
jgi:hypothetical protein